MRGDGDRIIKLGDLEPSSVTEQAPESMSLPDAFLRALSDNKHQNPCLGLMPFQSDGQVEQEVPFSAPRLLSPYTSSVLTLMTRFMWPDMRQASNSTCVP